MTEIEKDIYLFDFPWTPQHAHFIQNQFKKLKRREFWKRWMDFDPDDFPEQCVYMLGDFYIGQTNHLRRRINAHLRAVMNNDPAYPKSLKDHFWNAFLTDQTVKVWLLHDSPQSETEMIAKYRELGYPLINTGTSLDYPENKKITVTLPLHQAWDLSDFNLAQVPSQGPLGRIYPILKNLQEQLQEKELMV